MSDKWLANDSNYVSSDGGYISHETHWHGDESVEGIPVTVKLTEFGTGDHRVMVTANLDAVNEVAVKDGNGEYVLFIRNGEVVAWKENIREWLRKELINRVDLDDGRGDNEYERTRDDELTEVEV